MADTVPSVGTGHTDGCMTRSTGPASQNDVLRECRSRGLALDVVIRTAVE